jgi:hypothetical protein
MESQTQIFSVLHAICYMLFRLLNGGLTLTYQLAKACLLGHEDCLVFFIRLSFDAFLDFYLSISI